jgi:hypothetical protein
MKTLLVLRGNKSRCQSRCRVGDRCVRPVQGAALFLLAALPLLFALELPSFAFLSSSSASSSEPESLSRCLRFFPASPSPSFSLSLLSSMRTSACLPPPVGAGDCCAVVGEVEVDATATWSIVGEAVDAFSSAVGLRVALISLRGLCV